MDFAFLWETSLKLLKAVPITLELFALSLVFGGLLALIVLVMRIADNPLVNNFAKLYLLVFRGTPLMVQLFLIYYGLGQLEWIQESILWPILREPFWCAVLSISMCTAAYTAEILRGGLLAIPNGQIEAGKAIGMSQWLIIKRIIAPLTLRHSLPAYSTEAIMIVKSTTLASLVTVWEVSGIAQQIIQRSYRTMEVFICSAVIYLILNYLIIKLYSYLEKRLSQRVSEQATDTTVISSSHSEEYL